MERLIVEVVEHKSEGNRKRMEGGWRDC